MAGRPCADRVALTPQATVRSHRDLMTTQKSPWDQWAELNEIEYKLKLKSDSGVPPEDGCTDDQRIMATVNQVHFRSCRIERRQDILFTPLRRQQTAQRVDRVMLITAVMLLRYVLLR
ncbi:hypothetical protein PK69_23895 [Xanthomonas phaseoli pv. phaseoli]|uniref:Transposase n=2 Tax=Xanthomonas campestris pv. phaseoli TaxID=317013 RepID=A0AB34SQ37_XANCH|nr:MULTISPECIES: hypothetical protein [Xanthomonas]ATS22023.1 hypothetical protein XppCFBP412P_11575 [Xanthomonas phaseoli pv. phaseoli]ATS24832.1 hypothetical protein XppCFBP6164P_03845 [Xanthomonas phaseoli pv. phaseoli]ATS31822.1 hypothetical protein XppCFBP6546P_21005 [Xanthomonas phaseoli pv. phaseoli]ATS33150.1 hypothetical protein XppCFBP6982P_03810 [Xanthomonas phaseoli pv. phaseoli]AZU13980.1 hypothetical protein AC609_15045 [Xanthomonas phaseoli pv. phaseoli]